MTQNANSDVAHHDPPARPRSGAGAVREVRPADVAARTAQRTLAARAADYTSEVRRLLAAALELMRGGGTSSRPRVADIVAAAGLSNDAFYRHFPSKDALVSALIEDGADRLAGYAAHQMGKEADPAAKVRRWVEAILGQSRGEVAEITLAVLWNGSGLGGQATGRYPGAAGLAAALRDTFADLGSTEPDFDASLATYATLGVLSDHLWKRAPVDAAAAERVVAFCLRMITASPAAEPAVD